jgi:NADPH-dependent glutamate synthase beta subunit-like oxidoreductase
MSGHGVTPARLPVVPDGEWLWANEPCRAACPVHTDAGAYVTAIAAGRDQDAYAIARRTNPFVSICGRVCAAPCEAACRRGTLDAPVAIRALKRFVTERFGVESFAAAAQWHAAHGPVPDATGPSVGVIGGGPAGLAAAHDLRLAGHPVTIYEAADRLGGMLVQGIPDYRLPRRLIANEIDAIVELGIEVRTAQRIGADVPLDALLAEHAALFVAIGTSEGRTLDLPGAELDGIVRAIEFLLNVNQGMRVQLGERVVVVGGGNVAFDVARSAVRVDRERDMTTTLDAARSARRAGVEHVTVLALESPSEIPADADEIEEAESEGIEVVYRRGPHHFVGRDGRVTGLATIEVDRVFDERGRFAPTFVPGTEAVVDADTVILAVGQRADLAPFAALDLDRTPAGGIAVDRASLRSSDPRIWAGGDVARGPRNLIDAVADGQRAAASIHAALSSTSPTPAPGPPEGVRVELVPKPHYRRLASGYDAIARVPVPATPSDRRVGFAEVELGYGEVEARREGLRCLRCFDNIMLDPEVCILCGLCVDVCPTNCISIVRADHLELGSTEQSVLLLDEDRCIRCALCINRCPADALSMTFAKEVCDVR